MNPVVGGNIFYYASATEVQTARITGINPDGTIALVAFPSAVTGGNFQARINVPYAPNVAGGWGWNLDLRGDRYPAAQSLSGHRAVVLNEDRELIYADNTIPEHAHKVLGVIVDAGAKSDMLTVLNWQVASEPSWNWEPGRSLLLSTNGQITQDYSEIRNNGGFTLIVGEAIAPQSIFFAPKTPVMRM